MQLLLNEGYNDAPRRGTHTEGRLGCNDLLVQSISAAHPYQKYGRK